MPLASCRNVRKLVLRLAWIMGLLFLTGNATAGQDVEVERLRQQLQTDWCKLQEYDERQKSYDVHSLRKDVNPGTSPTQSEARYHVALDWPRLYRLASGTLERLRDGRRESLDMVAFGRNPRYAFVLVKEDGKGWCLRGKSAATPDKNSIDGFARGDGYILYPLSATVWDVFFADLAKDKEFQILSAEKKPDGKISFRFRYRFQIKPTINQSLI